MINKRKLIYRILPFALLASVVLLLISKQKPDAGAFIEKIREDNKAGFDSLNNALAKQNVLYAQIEESINQSNFKTASALIDSLSTNGERHMIHVFKGMIYAKQANYTKAIEQYNIAIQQDEFSKAIVKRAEAYIKLNKLALAISDYKSLYTYNYDFCLPLAKTFELNNQKDSALKYYIIYSEHYPDHQFTLDRIKVLKRKSI